MGGHESNGVLPKTKYPQESCDPIRNRVLLLCLKPLMPTLLNSRYLVIWDFSEMQDDCILFEIFVCGGVQRRNRMQSSDTQYLRSIKQTVKLKLCVPLETIGVVDSHWIHGCSFQNYSFGCQSICDVGNTKKNTRPINWGGAGLSLRQEITEGKQNQRHPFCIAGCKAGPHPSPPPGRGHVVFQKKTRLGRIWNRLGKPPKQQSKRRSVLGYRPHWQWGQTDGRTDVGSEGKGGGRGNGGACQRQSPWRREKIHTFVQF